MPTTIVFAIASTAPPLCPVLFGFFDLCMFFRLVHTDGIGNFCSLLKRGLKTFTVSKEEMQRRESEWQTTHGSSLIQPKKQRQVR